MSKNKILPEGRTRPQLLRTKNEQEEIPLVRFTILGIHRQLSTVIKKKTQLFANNLLSVERSSACQKETHNSKPIGFEEAEYCISLRLCQVPNARFFQIIPNSVQKPSFKRFFARFFVLGPWADLSQSGQQQRTGKVFRRQYWSPEALAAWFGLSLDRSQRCDW